MGDRGSRAAPAARNCAHQRRPRRHRTTELVPTSIGPTRDFFGHVVGRREIVPAGWTYEFTGANQQAAEALVAEAAEIAGVSIRGLRVGYSPNADFPLFRAWTDGRLTVIIDAGTMGAREQATRQLVAIHELLHKAHVDRVGYRNAALFQGNRAYEREIESQAFQILRDHYNRLGRVLPEETLLSHELYLRRLAE